MKAKQTVSKRRQYFLSLILIIVVLAFVSCTSPKPPKKEIIKGENLLGKTLFYQADMSEITYITQGQLDKHPGLDIGICSSDAMHIIDSDNGSLKSKVKFEWDGDGVGRPDVIFGNKDGDFNIVVLDLVGDIGIMDRNGNPLCMFRPELGDMVNNITAGDLDKNGELEFYVATYDGLYQLNASGKKVWKKGNDVYYVNIFDPGRNETPLVVTEKPHSIFPGIINYLQFRNYKGELIREIKTKIKVMGIEFVQWPQDWHIVTRNNNFYVLDLEGNVFLKDEIGFAIFDHRATTVRFFEDQSPYLAVVGRLRARYHRSILCIYSPDEKVFYKEIIGGATFLLSKKSPQSKCETLLVGDGPGKVYEYKPRIKRGKLSVNEDKSTQTDQGN